MGINASVLHNLANNSNSITKRAPRIPKIAVAGILVLIISLSLFAVILIVLTTNGPLKVEWQQYLPGISGEWVIQTSDGGFLALGYNASLTNDYSPEFTDYVPLAVKTDAYGDVVWAKTYSVAPEITKTRLSKVVETSDGYVFAGTLPDAHDFPYHFCIIKTNLNGDIVWNKTYSRSVSDETYELGGLIPTSDGGYALVGSFHSTPPSIDYLWFMKVDSSGNVQWNKTLAMKDPVSSNSYALSGRASALFQTNDSGYIIIGTLGSKAISPHSSQIIKIDSNGDVQWRKTYGGEGDYYYAYTYSATVTTDGGYLIAAVISLEKGWIIKTDGKGEMLWNKTYVYRSYPSTISSGSQADDGSYMFVGTATEQATPGVWDPNSKMYTWIARIDDAGNVLGQVAIDMGNHRSYPKNIVQTSDGGHVFVGVWNYESDPASFDQKFWLVKIAPIES
jgi:hypothetical protein